MILQQQIQYHKNFVTVNEEDHEENDGLQIIKTVSYATTSNNDDDVEFY